MSKISIKPVKTNKYKIDFLNSERFEDFINLNKQIYCGRKNTRERFQHHILQNPFLRGRPNTFILAVFDSKNNIIGQLVGNPYEFYMGKQHFIGFTHYDVYILPDYRGSGIGRNLYHTAINQLNPSFGIWFSKGAKKICLSLGAQTIGSLQTFIWINKINCILKVFLQFIFKDTIKPNKIETREFPTTLSINGNNFTLIDSINSLKGWNNNNWDSNTFITGRSLEFIKWRFFNSPIKFYFYLLNEERSQSYFVIKKSIQKGLNILEVIDYRVSYNDYKKFSLILDAAKKLTKSIEYDAFTITSTHNFFDKMLRKSFFINIGKSFEILLSPDIKVGKYKKDIKKRNFVIMTTIDLISEVDNDQ